MRFYLLLFSAMLSLNVWADEPVKGLLSEIRLNESNEELNQAKSFDSEVMITRTENKAIDSLKVIIKKKAGTSEEADLLYRLAELYMRRSKSGRFFDLDQSSSNKLKSLGLANQKAFEALKQASQIYAQILTKFPHYHDLDYVLFNNALAQAQLKDAEKAKKNYLQLISQFPNSELVADALLEVGEIFYQQQNFSTALQKFKEIEKFPESKAYPYGLYKSAWCYYNLKNTDDGIKQLLSVVKQNPANADDRKKYNLRKEALRDLTLFVGETLAADQVLGFFKKICTEDELGDVMFGLASLYESHSRFKEISIFVDEFIDAFPKNSQSPKLYTKLIDSFETLKQRDTVIKKLTQMARFCSDNEKNQDCHSEFKRISLEISKKWWDIWLKNKSNQEFSVLTEKAFENLLSIDSKETPDSTSRYAFAELLFQQNKFDRSAEQYEIVSLHPQLAPNLKHDSLYGALFSIEKLLEKKEDSKLTLKQKELGLRYVTEFRTGEHYESIVFKLGFIAYSQGDREQALAWLDPLIKSSKTVELREKAEDITLDIYNIKKDFVKIRALADSFKEKTLKPDRNVSLTKISEEAHYAQVQVDIKTLKPAGQIAALLAFSKEHQKTQLGQESYWQAISTAYSNALDVQGAELSVTYVKIYPDDSRNNDALKDAAKAFVDSAHFAQAIETLNLISKRVPTSTLANTELVCDLQKIQGGKSETRECYQSLLKISPASSQSAIIGKLLKTFSETKSAEYVNLQNTILKSDIEPFATQILIQKANDILARGDSKQAFSMSLKINARNVDEDKRAGARLIQAKVLENEFVSQSVKAREDKLAMVIAMKTEKLDKSFTAYSSAIKMSKDENIQREALTGITRLYTHFIESIGKMPLPDSLSNADQAALKTELNKVVQPFAEKRRATQEKLAQLSALPIDEIKGQNWASLSVKDSYETPLVLPSAQMLKTYYPSEPSVATSEMNSLLKDKKYAQAEEKALQLTQEREQRPLGLYYLSLIAENQQNTDKAQWLINKSLEIKANFAPALYQKAKVLYSVEGLNSSLQYFGKFLITNENHIESRLMLALKSFSDRDFKKVNSEFSRFAFEDIYNYGVDLIYVESKLQVGETENALKLAEASMQKNPERVNLDLELARIYESYLFNKEKSNFYYNKALGKAKSPELVNWLNKKIEFLKTNKNNQITSNVGGEL